MSLVRNFAVGVRNAETEGNYLAVRGLVRNARLVGAYGIPTDEWDDLAASAGLKGARWKDSKAQDKVAAAAFDALYAKYGDWRLVATAWKGGEELADRLAADPTLFDHPNLTELKKYVEKVMSRANESATLETSDPTMMTGEPPEMPFPQTVQDILPNDGMQRPQERTSGEQYMARMLTAMRNRRRKQVQGMAEQDVGMDTDGPDMEPDNDADDAGLGNVSQANEPGVV